MPLDLKAYEKAKKYRNEIDNHERLYIPKGVPRWKCIPPRPDPSSPKETVQDSPRKKKKQPLFTCVSP